MEASSSHESQVPELVTLKSFIGLAQGPAACCWRTYQADRVGATKSSLHEVTTRPCSCTCKPVALQSAIRRQVFYFRQ